MPEQANADDNVTGQRQTLLCIYEGVFETSAAAERDNFVLADHSTHAPVTIYLPLDLWQPAIGMGHLVA